MQLWEHGEDARVRAGDKEYRDVQLRRGSCIYILAESPRVKRSADARETVESGFEVWDLSLPRCVGGYCAGSFFFVV